MDNSIVVDKDLEYAIREAEIMNLSIQDSPCITRIINCAVRLSGEPYTVVEKAYHILKLSDINKYKEIV